MISARMVCRLAIVNHDHEFTQLLNLDLRILNAVAISYSRNVLGLHVPYVLTSLKHLAGKVCLLRFSI